MSGLARQLGRPEGLRGRLVGRSLNRGTARSLVRRHRPRLEQVGPRGHVNGVELSLTMLKASERRYRAACAEGRRALQAGSIGDLPLENESLDGLITVNTAYFVEDLEGAFREIARVLRPSERAVVGVADPRQWVRCPLRPMVSGFGRSMN